MMEKRSQPTPEIIVTPPTPLDRSFSLITTGSATDSPLGSCEISPPVNGTVHPLTTPGKAAKARSSSMLADTTPTTASLTSLVGRFPPDELRSPRGASRRLVFKDGTCNVAARHVTDRKWKYLADLFTTVLDLRWRWHFAMFAAAFVVSWTAFAGVWWSIAAVNGDLGDTGGDEDRSSTRCIANVDDFLTALMFSIETQHTIGYGSRNTEPNCVIGIATIMLQAGVGVFIQCLITGIIFSKLSRPKSRAQTILFSRYAVVCRRDGQHCLLFRVGDVRRSHIVGTSLKAVIVRNRLTREGESIPLCQYPIDVHKETGQPGGGDGSGDPYLFLVWPVTVVHRIDDRSPFWDMSAEQMSTERFEIIIILEGTVETNGKLTQVRTSYLPGEIRWGHRLAPLEVSARKGNLFNVDCARFHATIPAYDTPTCSARAYAAAQQRVQSVVDATPVGDEESEDIGTQNGSPVASDGTSAETETGDGGKGTVLFGDESSQPDAAGSATLGISGDVMQIERRRLSADGSSTGRSFSVLPVNDD